MQKHLTFLIIVIVSLGAIYYFFGRGSHSQYVAPHATSTVEIVTPTNTTPTNGAGQPIQGEFGDPAPQSSKPVVVQKKIVSGNYYYTEDLQSQYVGKICFRASGTNQGVGKTFCFDNSDEAFALLDISKGIGDGSRECTTTGPATVEVKNYTKLTGDAGGYDSATLTKLMSAGNQGFLACGEFK